MTTTMSVEDRLAIGDMITQFFACLDARKPEGLPPLFADDAHLDLGMPGRPPIDGKDAIGAAFGGAPTGRRTRHHWFALTITPTATGARATFQAVVYASEGGSPTARVANLSDTALDLVRDPGDGGWRFHTMRRTLVFAFD